MLPIRDTIPSRHLPWMTWSLIAVNVAVFLYQLALPSPELEQLFLRFGLVPARLSDPAWAASVGLPAAGIKSLGTSIFLHGGFLHLLFNMWTLWIFGDNVEDRMGPFPFLVFYLLSGLLAGVMHWVTNSASTLPTIGASGAIAGVLGAYFLLFPRSRVLTLVPILIYPLFFEIPAFVYLGFWFVSQLFSGAVGTHSGDAGGVAWWAHIGGFLAGILIYRFFLWRRQPDPQPAHHLVLADYPRKRL